MGNKKTTRPANSSRSDQIIAGSGNNFQVGGDMYINKNSGSAKLLKTILTVLTIVSTVIAIWSAIRNSKEIKQSTDSTPSTLLVSGIIRSKTTRSAIPDAFVTIDINLHDTVRTTSDGTFQLEVHSLPGKTIRIHAWANGYRLRDEFHTLGSPVEIELDKK
jgi:hypothetical protein